MSRALTRDRSKEGPLVFRESFRLDSGARVNRGTVSTVVLSEIAIPL
jgi:hypothetical protein